MGDVTQRTSLFRTCFSAGAITALSSAVCIAFSAPMLTRPILPGLALSVLAPFAVGFSICLFFGLLIRLFAKSLPYGPALLLPAVMLGAAPWWFIANAAEAERQWLVLPVLVILVVAVLFLPVPTRRGDTASFVLAVFMIVLPSDLEWNPHSHNGSVPTILFGLDGAPWETMEQMMAEGELPHISRIVRNGTEGRFEVPHPLYCGRLWAMAFSGYPAIENGVLFMPDEASDLKKDLIFDSVAELGHAVRVSGFPLNAISGHESLEYVHCQFGEFEDFGSESVNYLIYFNEFLDRLDREDLLTRFTFAMGFSALANSSANHCWSNMIHIANILLGRDQHRGYWQRREGILQNLILDRMRRELVREDPVLAAFNLVLPFQYLEDERTDANCAWAHGDGPHLHPEIPCEYFYFIMEMDRSIGRILESLDADGMNIGLISVHGTRMIPPDAFDLDRFNLSKISQENLPDLRLGFSRFYRNGNAIYWYYPENLDNQQLLEAKAIWEKVQIEAHPPAQLFTSISIHPEKHLMIMELTDLGSGSIPYVVQVSGARVVLEKTVENYKWGYSEKGRMILSGPKLTKGNGSVDMTIFDVAPTLRALMKLPPDENMSGRNLLAD